MKTWKWFFRLIFSAYFASGVSVESLFTHWNLTGFLSEGSGETLLSLVHLSYLLWGTSMTAWSLKWQWMSDASNTTIWVIGPSGLLVCKWEGVEHRKGSCFNASYCKEQDACEWISLKRECAEFSLGHFAASGKSLTKTCKNGTARFLHFSASFWELW